MIRIATEMKRKALFYYCPSNGDLKYPGTYSQFSKPSLILETDTKEKTCDSPTTNICQLEVTRTRNKKTQTS